jgi:hypothetical protein
MIPHLQTVVLLTLLTLSPVPKTYSQEMHPTSAEDGLPIQTVKTQKKSTQPVAKNFKSWQVKYNLSGGIAGLNQELLLLSDGQLLVTDQRRNIRKEKKAYSAQLAEARKLLESLQPIKSQTKPTQNCADCFHSEMTITLDKKTYAVDSGSLSEEDISYQNLNSFLSNLLKQTLAS